MELQHFKLAVAAQGEFSDDKIRKMIPNVVIGKEDDITDFLEALAFHRPNLLRELTDRVLGDAERTRRVKDCVT